jgi:hypothetical protein
MMIHMFRYLLNTTTTVLALCLGLPFLTTSALAEQLLAKPPDGWVQAYQLSNDATRLVEYVPEGESDTRWTAKLSFESFAGMVDVDPIEILLTEVTEDRKTCSFVQHFNLFSGNENNYPTSVRLFMCGERTGRNQGEIKIIKAISGESFFYLVKIISRIAPFEVNDPEFDKTTIASWSTYLRDVSLCNADNPSHPCPES